MQVHPPSRRIPSGPALVSSLLLRVLGRAGGLLAGLVFVTSVALAQATGTISGRVLNATNGQYLKNARVTVEGTTLEALTGEFGEYRISGVPAGAVTVRATYGALPPVSLTVAVTAGTGNEQNFNVGTVGVGQGDVVKLDEFVVSETRETNAAAIATTEQRYAPNMKSVVSSDAFGDVNEGNVGEFLKYLPGITVDYVAADVRTISVGGFASNFTGVNVNGNRMASAVSGNTDRVFELEQVSINNIARAEVTRVPTADQPMDTLGGSVNLISKSAFEQSQPSLQYKTNVNIPNENRDDLFRATPGPGNKKTYKNLPGFELGPPRRRAHRHQLEPVQRAAPLRHDVELQRRRHGRDGDEPVPLELHDPGRPEEQLPRLRQRPRGLEDEEQPRLLARRAGKLLQVVFRQPESQLRHRHQRGADPRDRHPAHV